MDQFCGIFAGRAVGQSVFVKLGVAQEKAGNICHFFLPSFRNLRVLE